MTRYYDYVLVLIPVVLLGLTAILLFAGIPQSLAVPVGAGAAVLIIGHALFVNVPGQSDPTSNAAPNPHQFNAD